MALAELHRLSKRLISCVMTVLELKQICADAGQPAGASASWQGFAIPDSAASWRSSLRPQYCEVQLRRSDACVGFVQELTEGGSMAEREWEGWAFLKIHELLLSAERIQRAYSEHTLAMQHGGISATTGQLPINVVETHGRIEITAAVPGATAAEIEARVEGRQVLLSWRRMLPKLPDACKIRLLEIPSGRIERRLTLPAPASLENIRIQDGLLVITLTRSRSTKGGEP